MTATTKPPIRERRSHRPIRFSSMETLGFSNPSATWTDSPMSIPHTTPATSRRGRHEAPEPEPMTVADWDPEDFGTRLSGRNIRWSIVTMVLMMLCGLGALAYWLYQRPAAQAEASLTSLSIEARALRDVLPILEAFSASLSTNEIAGSNELFDVDTASRALFDASGELSGTGSDLRSSAAQAATSSLDAIRLAGDASAYRLAVTPILVAPELETDPTLIELDQAARDFGDWQLEFDEVRTALPDQIMTETTQQLDILSGDLAGILTRYMDALREDDQDAADVVLDDLNERLAAVLEQMITSLENIKSRVTERIDEAQTALSHVLDH